LQIGALQCARPEARQRQDRGQGGRRQARAPHSANLYEGTLSGTLGAQADGHIALRDTLTGVAIGPLLRDVAQQDKLEGKGNLSLDVNAAGKSVSAMKKALAGTAKVDLRDGAIKGIDIGKILSKARSALGQQQAQAEASSERTDFSSMTASFNIKNGVAQNDDLDVKAPVFRITGAGKIDIGNSNLDYVTKAAVVATAKGQGGAEVDQLSGITVPVRLSGSFDNLKYDVNYGAVATDLAKSKAGEKLREKLEERLGVGKSDDKSGQGGSTADKLRGLFGR
jgi:AsmA protein